MTTPQAVNRSAFSRYQSRSSASESAATAAAEEASSGARSAGTSRYTLATSGLKPRAEVSGAASSRQASRSWSGPGFSSLWTTRMRSEPF